MLEYVSSSSFSLRALSLQLCTSIDLNMGNTLSSFSCCANADDAREVTEVFSVSSSFSAGFLTDLDSDQYCSDSFKFGSRYHCEHCLRGVDPWLGAAATWPPRNMLSGAWRYSPSPSAEMLPENRDSSSSTPVDDEADNEEWVSGVPLADCCSGSSEGLSTSSPIVSVDDEEINEDVTEDDILKGHDTSASFLPATPDAVVGDVDAALVPPDLGAVATGQLRDDDVVSAAIFLPVFLLMFAGGAEYLPGDVLHEEDVNVGDAGAEFPEEVNNGLLGDEDAAPLPPQAGHGEVLIPEVVPEVVQEMEEDPRWYNGFLDFASSDSDV